MTKRLTIALIALVALVLVAVLPVSATYYDINNTVISTGATLYAGEQQLNLTPAQPVYVGAYGIFPEQIGWWASSANPLSSTPSAIVTLTGSNNSFYVAPTSFAGTFGSNGQSNWYVIDPATGYAAALVAGTINPAFITAADPNLGVDIWDLSTATTVTSGTVIQGDYLAIKVSTNLQSAINSPTTRENDTLNNLNNPQVGNIDLKVKSSSGNTYTALFANTTDLSTKSITQQNVTAPVWYWGTMDGNQPSAANWAPNWSTGAVDASGQLAYPAGVYTVIAQSRLNGMYDNYLNGGATYTGKTISQPATVTITSNTVALSANVNSVVRSKPFSVTITGKPYMTYHLWVKGTGSMSGIYNNQPPYITPNQAGVVQDNPITGPAANTGNPITDNGLYYIENGGGSYYPTVVAGRAIINDTAPSDKYQTAYSGTPNTATTADIALGNGTFVYGNISLDQTGTRTVQFSTTNWTKAQQYTIRVEQDFANPTGYKYDEVNVQVQQGAVTIVAAGSQSYYLGEEVQFSGTNTESQDTYLYITGPNLPTQGTTSIPTIQGTTTIQQHPPAIWVSMMVLQQGSSRSLSMVTTPGPGSGALQPSLSMQVPTRSMLSAGLKTRTVSRT